MLGYKPIQEDEWALNYSIDKTKQAILDDIIASEVPSSLYYAHLDMAAVNFLRDKNKDSRTLKDIFDKAVNQLANYRRLRW